MSTTAELQYKNKCWAATVAHTIKENTLTKYYDKTDLDVAMHEMTGQIMTMEDRLSQLGVAQPHLTTMGLYITTALAVAEDSYIPVGARLSEVRSIKQNVDALCKDLEHQLQQEQKRYQDMNNVIYVDFTKRT
jgi:hypothetical protein